MRRLPISRVRLTLLAAFSVAAVTTACNALLNFDQFDVGATNDAGQDGNAVQTDSGEDANNGTSGTVPEGGSLDGCVPGTDKLSLENACTAAVCVPFDNTRLKNCTGAADGGIIACPTPPVSDAGIPAKIEYPDGGFDGGAFPRCTDLDSTTYPRPLIYGSGSSALSLYVGKIAQAFESTKKGTIIYQAAGSCYGYYTTVLGYELATVPVGGGNGLATYFDPNTANDTAGVPKQGTCVIDDPAQTTDFGVSDVFPTTCLPSLKTGGGSLPTNLHDFFGPVQTMVLAVPATSTQTSISAEAAYMAFGFGATSGVAPWTNEAQLLQRNGSSGTQSMMSAAIGLPDPFAWKGKPHGSQGAVLTDLAAAGTLAESTMGVMGADFVENQRASVKALAIQDRRQTCGYYPDSTPTAHDKQNVRDGHYPVWGPSHFVVPVNSSNGAILNDKVKDFIDALSGTTVINNLNILQTYVDSHLVPVCAMHVTRTSDGEDYRPFKPPVSCSCYFDSIARGSAPPECRPCKTTTDCAGATDGRTTCNSFGSPSVGFCEPPGE